MEKKRDRSAYNHEWFVNNREKRNAYAREYAKTDTARKNRNKKRDERRNFIFKTLGESCKHCGFSDRRALQMDHIHGRNGEKRIGNIDMRWRFVRDDPAAAKNIYQILCANCNFIKREENFEHFYHGAKRLN